MRFVFRLLAFVSLAIAVIAAVIDGSRSLSAERLVLTPFADGWASIAPNWLAAVQAFIQEYLPAFVWDPGFVFILQMPAAAVFAVVAALLYSIGAKREKPFGEIRMR